MRPTTKRQAIVAPFGDLYVPGTAIHYTTANVALIVSVDPGPVATTESHRVFVGRTDGQRMIAVQILTHTVPPGLIVIVQSANDVGMVRRQVVALAQISADIIEFMAVDQSPMLPHNGSLVFCCIAPDAFVGMAELNDGNSFG